MTSYLQQYDIRVLFIIVISLLLVLAGVAGIMQNRNYKNLRESMECDKVISNPRMLFGLSVIVGIVGVVASLAIVFVEY